MHHPPWSIGSYADEILVTLRSPRLGQARKVVRNSIARRMLSNAAFAVARLFQNSALAKKSGHSSSGTFDGIAAGIKWKLLGDEEAVVTASHKASFQKQFGGVQRPGPGPFSETGARFIPIGVGPANRIRASQYGNDDLVFVQSTSFRQHRMDVEERSIGGMEPFRREQKLGRGLRSLGRRYANYVQRQAVKTFPANEIAGFLIDPDAPRGQRTRYLLYSALTWATGPDKWFPAESYVRKTFANNLHR